jgi:hypothetical protein
MQTDRLVTAKPSAWQPCDGKKRSTMQLGPDLTLLDDPMGTGGN